MSNRGEKTLSVGIAGLGRSGWNLHAAALEDLSDRFRIVAVSDAHAERRKEAVERYGCRAYDAVEALLGDPDVELAVVATPSHLHCRHTIAALNAGKHVVCEKPMALCVEEADRMLAAARESGRVLTVFQSQRYAPDFVKAREIIESGVLGRIVMVRIAVHSFSRRWDWQTLKEFGGGELNNTGAHCVDQALQLLGDKEPEIFCDLQRTLTSGDAEDHCKVILRAPDAPLMDIEITRACAWPQDQWLVMGTRGGLKGNSGQLRWKYVDFDKLPPRPVDRTATPDRTYNSEDLSWHEDSWKRPEDAPLKKAIPFYLDLYRTLREGAPLVITPESVRRLVAVLEECHRQCPL